jgi:hypothetical protein
MSGGRLTVFDGALEIHGGLVSLFLRRCVPIAGGSSAMTLGHVVMGRDLHSLDSTRRHERVHVRQCEVWGPLFIPAYLGSSLWAILRRKDPYYENHFERQAYEREADSL